MPPRAALLRFGLVFVLVARAFGADPVPTYTRLQLLELWGWQVAHQEDLVGADLRGTDLGTFLRGVANQLQGAPPPCDLAKANGDIDALVRARRTTLLVRREQQNLAIAEAFFENLKRDGRAELLPSGLGIEIKSRGRGPAPKPEQTVSVRYVGHRVTGEEFIQMDPHDLILVPNRVNRGLFEGLQRIPAGSKATLYVPPRLLVGDEEKLGLPVGAAAVFDVEVLEVKPTSAEDLANAQLPPAPEPPPPPPSGLPVSRLIEAWGWTVAQRTGAASFALKPPEVTQFVVGLGKALSEKNPPELNDTARRAVQAFVAAERERVRAATKQKRLNAMAAFFAELKKNPRVVELPDGLRYEIVEPGTGACPKPGQIVVVDYTGRLLDGTVFDRTDNEPLRIQVGSVIEGFNEGIQKVAKGGRIKLYVPPSIGYGDEDMSGVISKIPAHSTLVYDIKLLDIQEAEKN